MGSVMGSDWMGDGVVDGCGMNNWVGLDYRVRDPGGCSSVSGLAFISDIGYITIDVIGVVGHDLGATIGKSHAVFASHDSIGILINETSKSCFNLSS